jgi:hypothetical protein
LGDINFVFGLEMGIEIKAKVKSKREKAALGS